MQSFLSPLKLETACAITYYRYKYILKHLLYSIVCLLASDTESTYEVLREVSGYTYSLDMGGIDY